MITLRDCNLCGSQDFRYLFTEHDRRHHIGGEFHLYQCRRCHLIFLNPQPEPEELKRHYPEDYSYFRPQNKGGIIKEFIQRIIKKLMAPLERVTIAQEGTRVLDVGCGNGTYLEKITAHGVEAVGIEPSEAGYEEARRKGLNVMNVGLYEAQFPDNYFDYITLHQVLEHLSDPRQALEKLKRILKKNGQIVISVPNYNSCAFRLFRQYWPGLDAPRHLYTFSDYNLREYAEKVQLKVIKIRYISRPSQFTGAIQYLINRFKKRETKLMESRIRNNLILDLLLFPLVYFLNLIKQGDMIEVYFKKPPEGSFNQEL